MKPVQVFTAVAAVGLIASLLVYPLDRVAVGLMLAVAAFIHLMALLLAGWVIWYFLSHKPEDQLPCDSSSAWGTTGKEPQLFYLTSPRAVSRRNHPL